MANMTGDTRGNIREEKWYESTLPIALTIILSIIFIILIIVRVVQCCQERKAKKLVKRAKAKDHSLEEGKGEEEEQSKTSALKKRGKLIKLGKHKEATDATDATPIVPANENGSLLQSGIRTNPTRKAENKSWYDSKVIPYIDDGGASLDNLYLPENAIQEVV